ncbi:DUF4340 domain-containing protein [Brachyspira catarrhinii]|uniref:DUF4340 domain-containing protein n=1 Tax=Brachyspira catarrhinii TaxID=2528966 RepID=A0ABY2TPH4_9SPIR|nr:DUF4340 domain-containing protein [Brachyspira catarrhinii]TKZ33145.1 DUF4340 domain-containing protein [Brachyspira catarrhinii]
MNKNLTKLLILVIILLIISFAAFYITKKRSAEIAANKPRVQIFELNETNVNKYELIFESEPIIVEKINDIWKIISPLNASDYKVDQLEAFANVKNFNTLNIDMIITNLSEVESFGLENPTNEFTVWEGNKEYKIFVGNRTADEERYYVKYNDEYFSVESIYIDALKKNIDMLRDKEIFNAPVSLDSVRIVEITAGDYTNIIRKASRTNWIVENLDGETDLEKAYNDFSTLSLIKASAFVYEVPRRIERLFRIPDAVINLYMQDNTKITYQLAYDIDNKIYAKPESGIIYEVDYSIYDAAMRGKEYYRKNYNDSNSN